jgi:hypothetical protein
MEVVRHQCPGLHGPAEAQGDVVQEALEHVAVERVEHDQPPLDAAHGHVVDGGRGEEAARHARHGSTLRRPTVARKRWERFVTHSSQRAEPQGQSLGLGLRGRVGGMCAGARSSLCENRRMDGARMVFLGFGKYARADRIYALQPITGDNRGGGQRTLVWVEGIGEPLIASRTERTILHDMGQEAAGVAVIDEAVALAERIVADADRGRVDLTELGRQARRLLDATRPPEPPKLF